MRFTINLATRAIFDQRLVNRVCVFAVAALSVLLIWSFFRFSLNFGEASRLDSEMAAADKRLKSAPPGISEQEHARILSETTFYNGIIKRKTFGWIAFLEQLETATPEGVAVSSLSPDMGKGIIKIEGWARSFRGVQAYLEMLEDSGNFHDILLLSHKNEELWEKARGVRFSVSCLVNQP